MHRAPHHASHQHIRESIAIHIPRARNDVPESLTRRPVDAEAPVAQVREVKVGRTPAQDHIRGPGILPVAGAGAGRTDQHVIEPVTVHIPGPGHGRPTLVPDPGTINAETTVTDSGQIHIRGRPPEHDIRRPGTRARVAVRILRAHQHVVVAVTVHIPGPGGCAPANVRSVLDAEPTVTQGSQIHIRSRPPEHHIRRPVAVRPPGRIHQHVVVAVTVHIPGPGGPYSRTIDAETTITDCGQVHIRSRGRPPEHDVRHPPRAHQHVVVAVAVHVACPGDATCGYDVRGDSADAETAVPEICKVKVRRRPAEDHIGPPGESGPRSGLSISPSRRSSKPSPLTSPAAATDMASSPYPVTLNPRPPSFAGSTSPVSPPNTR